MINSNLYSGLLLLLVTLILINPLHVRGGPIPPSPPASTLEHQAYGNGAYTHAISLLKQKLDSNNSKTLTNLGGVEFNKGNYSGATFYFQKALSLDKYHQGALLGLGEIEEVLGGNNNNSLAQSYFRQVLTIPAITDYQKLVHAISLTHLGHYAQAMLIVNQVLKSRPNYIDALMAKGNLLLYQRNYTGALTIFNQVLTTHPILTLAIDSKAIALGGLTSYKEAQKLFNKSISLNPKDVDAWYNIGLLLDYSGNFTGAFAAYAQAQKLTPHNKDVLWNEGLTLGVVLYQYRNFSDAVKVYDTMLKVEPHNPYLLEMRNLNLDWEKGLLSESSTSGKPANYTAARDYFAKILQITPKDSEANNNEGLALFHLGNKAAIKFFNRSIALDPSDIDALWNKAYALLEFGNNTGAASAFHKVLQMNPHDAAANDDYGIVLFNLNNKTALTFFSKAIKLNATDSNAWFNKGAFLQSEKDYKGAIFSYHKGLYPGSPG